MDINKVNGYVFIIIANLALGVLVTVCDIADGVPRDKVIPHMIKSTLISLGITLFIGSWLV